MMFFLFDCTVVATCNFCMISESQAIIRKFICFCCNTPKALHRSSTIDDAATRKKTISFAYLSGKGSNNPSINSTHSHHSHHSHNSHTRHSNAHTTTTTRSSGTGHGKQTVLNTVASTTSTEGDTYKPGRGDPVPVRSRTNSINTDCAISEVRREHERAVTFGSMVADSIPKGIEMIHPEVEMMPDISPKLEQRITDFDEDDVPADVKTKGIDGQDMEQIDLDMAHDEDTTMPRLSMTPTNSAPVRKSKKNELDMIREEIDECVKRGSIVIVYEKEKLENIASRSSETRQEDDDGIEITMDDKNETGLSSDDNLEMDEAP
eukprot:CAMPEP_0201572210 /NCGR_PEP_ID=MMETSP0190_2-20130828/15355_1 /ASSEMBLY_ACC=CAM_ASM_000263 /TAXON_ID=37353 /ORGANISM="Rosalina sp." /LENGTH=319 /DNA_ID=CAMNT_0047997687 /DNA_START=35 /DNA_END=994 /DNA_ORIENTATION=-